MITKWDGSRILDTMAKKDGARIGHGPPALTRVDFNKDRDMVRPEDTSPEHVAPCQELTAEDGWGCRATGPAAVALTQATSGLERPAGHDVWGVRLPPRPCPVLHPRFARDARKLRIEIQRR